MTPLLHTAGWALIHFVWQGAAIAALASCLLTLTRRRTPGVRYAIACIGLSAMLAAPFITARLIWIETSASAVVEPGNRETRDAASVNHGTTAVADASIDGAAPSNRSGGSVPPSARLDLSALEPMLNALTIAWLAGVAMLLARLAGGWWRVRRLHRVALSMRSSRWQSSCRRLAYRLGLPAAAHVVESALVDVPTVVGWLRPAILLPIAALASLSPAQVEAILAHELAHIRRHDYAVNVLQTLVETLLFYHPAVWWLSNRVRVEREHCCDDAAIALCGDPIGYAQALADLAAWRTVATPVVLAATGGSLLDRVRRILRVEIADQPRSPNWAVTIALTMIFTAGAGTVQHLPWILTPGDARAASARLDVDRVTAAPPVADGRPQEDQSAPQAPAPPAPPAAPVPPPSLHDRADAEWAPPAPSAPPTPPVPPTSLHDWVDADDASTAPPAPPAPPTPPAPPAPPAPRAPLAPRAPREPRETHFQWSDNFHRFDLRLRGTLAFTDDLTDVQQLSDGGVLTIRDWSAMIPHTVEIRSANGSIERAYFVAGLTRPWDDEARQFLATQLPIVVRASGIGADARVKSIFARGGVGGVFDEIDRLGGDYARRLYLVALIEIAQFDAASVEPLLQRVGRLFTSDYDRRQVLEQIATRVPLDRKGAASYVQAMATMRSDYDQREALAALISHGTAADGDTLLPALAHLKSSYDKRMVIEGILARGPLGGDGKQTVLSAVPAIASDYDRRQVLTMYLDRFGVERSAQAPFFAAVQAITSNYDRREILTRVASNGSADRDLQHALIAAVEGMTSDFDRAEVLIAVVPGVDAATRSAFVSAAERIKSSHDQNRVLAALAKSERR